MSSGAPDLQRRFTRGRNIALASVVVSAGLAALNIVVGLRANSTSVLATGLEFAGDVMASGVVLVGLILASRPSDANHPYGHGRLETIAGLTVGMILAAGGAGICYRSLEAVNLVRTPPGSAALWALSIAITVRTLMSVVKFRSGRLIGSAALVADAWNDTVDILSAGVALAAVMLARWDPERFLAADHYGGFAVGLVVILMGLRVVRETTMELADTMPDPAMTERVRAVALAVAGVAGVEKQLARKTGLQYHVDLHVEVDPTLTVLEGHAIAHEVRRSVRDELPWVADVLVHIEPARDPRAKHGVMKT